MPVYHLRPIHPDIDFSDKLLAPPDMRARVLSTYVMVTFGIQPIAALVVGLSAQWLGTPTAIFINGATMFTLVALILIFRKGLRDWEVARPTVAAAPSANP